MTPPVACIAFRVKRMPLIMETDAVHCRRRVGGAGLRMVMVDYPERAAATSIDWSQLALFWIACFA